MLLLFFVSFLDVGYVLLFIFCVFVVKRNCQATQGKTTISQQEINVINHQEIFYRDISYFGALVNKLDCFNKEYIIIVDDLANI